ncbi:hypothetical protein GCM10020255_048510 [Rhodococcus baikonurensis]
MGIRDRKVHSSEFDLKSIDFDAVSAKVEDVLSVCRIIIDNFRSDDRLDYSTDGQIAIAVGGTLSVAV